MQLLLASLHFYDIRELDMIQWVMGSAFYVIEHTGMAFRNLFLMDFQNLNPMFDENWTKLRNSLWIFKVLTQ
jgi:hypothetical protein